MKDRKPACCQNTGRKRHPPKRRQVGHCVLLNCNLVSGIPCSGDKVGHLRVVAISGLSASSLAAATGRTTYPCRDCCPTHFRDLQSRQCPHRRNVGHVVRDKPKLRDHAVLDLGRAFPAKSTTFPSNPGFNSISFLLTASICLLGGQGLRGFDPGLESGRVPRFGNLDLSSSQLCHRPIRSCTWAGLFAGRRFGRQ